MARQRTPQEEERIEQVLRDNPEFLRSLADEDNFRAIIIGQTYIEAVLNQLIDHHGATPRDRYLTLSRKIKLAVGFGGIPAAWSQVLLKLGNIRNEFAHELGHREMSPESMEALRGALDASDNAGLSGMVALFLARRNIADYSRLAAQPTDAIVVRAAIMWMFEGLLAAYEAQHLVRGSKPYSQQT